MKAIVNRKAKEFYVPWDEGLYNLVPDSRKVRHPEHGIMVALPHAHDTTRLARNYEHIVPAPITKYYQWPGPKPFKTQRVTAALLTMNSRAYVLSEMGTGKTRSALFSIDFMLREGVIKNALVLAPLSTLSTVWDREIFEYFPHLETRVVYGTKARREKLLNEKADIYILNHHGPKVVGDLLRKMQFDCVVLDEIGVYRNASTDLWKAAKPLVDRSKYAWGMTGSPTPNEPVDAWGIAKLLTPSRVPKHEKAFRRQTMIQVSQFTWVPKQEANDIVYEALQPAVRYRRDDCIELPPTVYLDREVEMHKDTKRVYDELMQKLVVAFQEGKVKAANEGVLMSKLLQIASGWVYTKDKGVIQTDVKNKIQEVRDIVDEALGKLIIFCEFTTTAEGLYRTLAKKMDCELVTGATSKKQRDDIFGRFQRYVSPRVIVAHPKCMSHGLTLTEANTIVWFTPTTSLETYEQACARITRPGQKRKTAIVHLVSSPIEKKLYARLKKKASTQGALLEMFNDN